MRYDEDFIYEFLRTNVCLSDLRTFQEFNICNFTTCKKVPPGLHFPRRSRFHRSCFPWEKTEALAEAIGKAVPSHLWAKPRWFFHKQNQMGCFAGGAATFRSFNNMLVDDVHGSLSTQPTQPTPPRWPCPRATLARGGCPETTRCWAAPATASNGSERWWFWFWALQGWDCSKKLWAQKRHVCDFLVQNTSVELSRNVFLVRKPWFESHQQSTLQPHWSNSRLGHTVGALANEANALQEHPVYHPKPCLDTSKPGLQGWKHQKTGFGGIQTYVFHRFWMLLVMHTAQKRLTITQEK